MKKLIFGRSSKPQQQPQQSQQQQHPPSPRVLSRRPTLDSSPAQVPPTQVPPTHKYSPLQGPPTTPAQQQQQQHSYQSTRSLPPIPGKPHQSILGTDRQDSVSSHHSLAQQQQPPATRASFQLQRPAQPPALVPVAKQRKPSQESPDAWVVVDAGHNGTSSASTTADPLFVRAQPSFESRSSSLASLPPGASPPTPYPPPSPYPSEQPPQQPPTPLHPPQNSLRRPLRKLSDPVGPNGYYNAKPPSHHQRTLNGAAASAENLSLMSGGADMTIQNKEKPDKAKRGLFDWLGGEREKIAKERTRAITPGGIAPSLGPDGQPWDLTRLMGFVTATASEDWVLLMELCDQASTDSGAKEAAKALRSEIKYADPPAMLSAARLWAIMLRNTKHPFIQQTSSRKFVDAVEEAYTAPETSPVVRDRLSIVIAGAAHQYGDKYPGFRHLWKKVKPSNAPAEGIPFDPKDAMFSPPSRRLPKPAGFVADPNARVSVSNVEMIPAATSLVSLQSSTQQQVQAPGQGMQVPMAQYTDERERERERRPHNNGGGKPHRSHRSSKMGIISPEEDVRRLFEECKIAKNNASLLSNALTYAKPEEVVTGGAGGLIREFHINCMRSQELVSAQIPWATAQSDRARTMFLQTYPEAPGTESLTEEEDLLAELLSANQELVETFRVYDEIERLAVLEREEREVQARSRVETRLDRTQIQYYAADGSFMTQPIGGGTGSGPSRSPSPSLVQQSSPPPSRAPHPLPAPPSSTLQAPAQPQPNHHPNGSSNTLAPPPPAPHGPRRPSSTRSRSPSPDRASRRSMDAPRSTPMNGHVTPAAPAVAVAAPAAAVGVAAAHYGGRLDSLKRGMSKLGLDVKRSRSGSLTNGSTKGRKSAEIPVGGGVAVVGAGGQPPPQPQQQQQQPQNQVEEDEDTLMTPIQPSAKALGKRRAETPPEEPFDTDDLFKDRVPTPLAVPEDNSLNSDEESVDEDNLHHNKHVVYAYDAAAEREKELLEEVRALTPRIPVTVPATTE